MFIRLIHTLFQIAPLNTERTVLFLVLVTVWRVAARKETEPVLIASWDTQEHDVTVMSSANYQWIILKYPLVFSLNKYTQIFRYIFKILSVSEKEFLQDF